MPAVFVALFTCPRSVASNARIVPCQIQARFMLLRFACGVSHAVILRYDLSCRWRRIGWPLIRSLR